MLPPPAPPPPPKHTRARAGFRAQKDARARSHGGAHLNAAGPEAPFQLYGGDGMDGVRPPDLVGAGLADPQVLHFALLHQFLHPPAMLRMQ